MRWPGWLPKLSKYAIEMGHTDCHTWVVASMGFPNQTGKDVDQPLHKTIMVTPGSLWIMWFNCKWGRSTSYTSYKMWCVICDNVLWYGYLIPLLYAGIIIWRIARLYGPDAHTGLPLALGKHPRREGVTPHLLCHAICLACVDPIPIYEALFLSFCPKIPLLPLKAWGHALQRGSVWHAWDLGDPRL